MTPVIIRYEGPANPRRDRSVPRATSRSKHWELRDLIAVFPTLVGGYGDFECYSIVDGHSTCNSAYVRTTKPATKEQIEAMLRALERAGYTDLKVIKKVTAAHRRASTSNY